MASLNHTVKDAFEEPRLPAVSDDFQARTESVLRCCVTEGPRSGEMLCQLVSVSKTLPLRRSRISHPSHKVPSIFPCGLPPPETGRNPEEWNVEWERGALMCKDISSFVHPRSYRERVVHSRLL